MSLFSSLVKKVGHVVAAPVKGLVHAVTDPGDWAKNLGKQAIDPRTLIGLASAVALPGVGGALGSALGALPGASAIGGALGSAGGAVASAAGKIPGVSSLGNALKNVAGFGGSAGASAIPDSAMGIAQPGILDTIRSGVASAGKGLLLGSDGKIGVDDILRVGSGVEGYQNSKKSENAMKQALALVNQQYANDGAYRTAAQTKLLTPERANLASVYRNTQNPFSR